jgi:hypothetical protein
MSNERVVRQHWEVLLTLLYFKFWANLEFIHDLISEDALQYIKKLKSDLLIF